LVVSEKKIVAVILARMDSRRLPGKGLIKINGNPALYYLVARLRQVKGIDNIVIATTDRYCDRPLIHWAKLNKISYYTGSLKDILSRFYGAALKYDADIVIKANGDCPLLSPEVIAIGLSEIVSMGYEFLTGKNQYTGLPVGLGAEIITLPALARLNKLAKTHHHRDNITTYIFDATNEFNWGPIKILPEWKATHMDLTLDTKEDLGKIKAITEYLDGDNPGEWKIEKIIEAYEKI